MTQTTTTAAAPAINAIINAMGAQRKRRNQIVRDYLAECDNDLVILDMADEVRGLTSLIEAGLAHDAKDSEVLAEVGQHYWQGKPELKRLFVANMRSIIDAIEA